MNDPDLLHLLAEGLLSVITEGVVGADWVPAQTCVTVGEPAPMCDSINVWVDRLAVDQNCNAAVHRVTFGWALTLCLPVSEDDSCSWWEDQSATIHGAVWQAWVGLVDAWILGDVCGVECENVTIDPLLLSTDGNFAVWRSSITLSVSPIEAAS